MRLLLTSLNIFWEISAFIPQLRLKKMMVAQTTEKKSQIWDLKKLENNSEFEKIICFMVHFGGKNSNFLRNLRCEKISAMAAPRKHVFFCANVKRTVNHFTITRSDQCRSGNRNVVNPRCVFLDVSFFHLVASIGLWPVALTIVNV